MDTNRTIPELLSEHSDRVTISIEILPPLRGDGLNYIFDIMDEIKDLDPLWVDITSHSANVEWISSKQSEVTYLKNKRRRAPGTIAISAALKYKYNMITAPHVLCNGFSKEETEDALIDLDYLGVNNVLAIRGDEGTQESKTTMHGSNNYAIDLLQQIIQMNHGQYLDQKAHSTSFCVGVACYPEKHVEAPNMAVSDNLLYEKQQMGASYAVSQMFYNNEKYFDFINRIKDKVTIPIVPALKIMTSAKQLITLPKHFYIDIPQDLVERMQGAKSKTECHDVGVEWAFQQCVSLIENGHNHLHFYIMRNTNNLLRVYEMLDEKYGIRN